MKKIIVDDVLRGLLGDLTGPLELCDEHGRVLGRFIPHADEAIGENEPPPLLEEEIRRRLEGEPTYTTAEVLAYLESLD